MQERDAVPDLSVAVEIGRALPFLVHPDQRVVLALDESDELVETEEDYLWGRRVVFRFDNRVE